LKPDNLKPYLVLALGILAVSSAAILISFARAEGIPAVAIAALRLTLASLVLARCDCSRETSGSALRRDLMLAISSGILLASLRLLDQLARLYFSDEFRRPRSTNPLFVGARPFCFYESLGAVDHWHRVAALGTGLIGYSDLGQAGAESLQGDALALAGAVAVSGYLLIGRRLRKQLSLLAYIGLVYTTAAIVLIAMAIVMQASLFGYSFAGYAFVLLLALGPQLIGHSSYNWALKYLSATFITITLLAEPIGATLLAIPLLSQVPSPIKLFGGTLILVGIFLAARTESKIQVADEAEALAEV
jgi:hypothetical protein